MQIEPAKSLVRRQEPECRHERLGGPDALPLAETTTKAGRSRQANQNEQTRARGWYPHRMATPSKPHPRITIKVV